MAAARRAAQGRAQCAAHHDRRPTPMNTTNRKLCLLTTASVEAGAGLCLLFLPVGVFAMLLGLERVSVEAIFVGRFAGAALLALGVACWVARDDTLTPAQRGLLTGMLVYNAVASMLLAYAGVVLEMVGVLLWPAAALHAILAIWCFGCPRPDGVAADSGGEDNAVRR